MKNREQRLKEKAKTLKRRNEREQKVFRITDYTRPDPPRPKAA